MKILILNWQDIKNPFGGGAEVHMHEIFKRIAAMGHDISEFAVCHHKHDQVIYPVRQHFYNVSTELFTDL